MTIIWSGLIAALIGGLVSGVQGLLARGKSMDTISVSLYYSFP
jgi:hypothetical protein